MAKFQNNLQHNDTQQRILSANKLTQMALSINDTQTNDTQNSTQYSEA